MKNNLPPVYKQFQKLMEKWEQSNSPDKEFMLAEFGKRCEQMENDYINENDLEDYD